MWPEFGNSAISTRGFYNFNFVSIGPEKRHLLSGGIGSSSIIWVQEPATRYGVQILQQCSERVKTKS